MSCRLLRKRISRGGQTRGPAEMLFGTSSWSRVLPSLLGRRGRHHNGCLLRVRREVLQHIDVLRGDHHVHGLLRSKTSIRHGIHALLEALRNLSDLEVSSTTFSTGSGATT